MSHTFQFVVQEQLRRHQDEAQGGDDYFDGRVIINYDFDFNDTRSRLQSIGTSISTVLDNSEAEVDPPPHPC